MTKLLLALQYGLINGAILSAFMTLFIFGSLYHNPEIWWNDAPRDIQERFGPMSDKAKGQRTAWAIPMFGGLIAFLVWTIIQWAEVNGGELTFLPLFVLILVMFMTFNLWDLVIIDWLVAIILQPKWLILPGTEGAAGYKDYGFHFRGFLKGTVGIVLFSGVIAAVAAWVV